MTKELQSTDAMHINIDLILNRKLLILFCFVYIIPLGIQRAIGSYKFGDFHFDFSQTLLSRKGMEGGACFALHEIL